jgi:inosine/xanthosine triphosphate pyrophosphatase family protein
MPEILFATHNFWKARLFLPSFQAYGFTMKTLQDFAPDHEPRMETGKTAIENALSKARYYHCESHPWVFADDAGLKLTH